jgi:hypothetical protein
MNRSIRPIVALLAFAVGGLAAQNNAVQPGGPPRSPIRTTLPVPPEIDGVRVVAPDLYEFHGPRPLESAADLLQMKFGVPVSVEEPPWAAVSDVAREEDVAEEPRDSRREERTSLVPRGGTFRHVIEGADHGPSASETIRGALSQYMARNNPGEFELLELGDQGFSIVPKRIKNAGGTLVASPRILDMRISFPEQRRSLDETLSVFREALSRVSGLSVVDFSPIGSNYLKVGVTAGANNERARDVLVRLLRMPGATKISWRIRYSPQWHRYGMFLTWIARETVGPDGSRQLEPVVWPIN